MHTDSHTSWPRYTFQLVSIPESEAPLEHCTALVGKVFPLMPRNMDGPEPLDCLEVESGLPAHHEDAVCVDLTEAVRILRAAGEGGAADYWASRDCAVLVFPRSKAKIVPYPAPW